MICLGLFRLRSLQLAWQRLLRSITHSFDDAFEGNISSLQRQMQNLRDEVQIAHMARVEASQMEVLSGVSRTLLSNESLVLHAVKKERQEVREAIIRWLDPVDMADDLNRARKKRTPGTGLWLLGHDRYTTWKKSPDSHTNTMAIFGRPGSGKTVLTAAVVNDLEQSVRLDSFGARTPVVTYFFCHAAEENKRAGTDIYATLLAQMIPQLVDVPSPLEASYNIALQYGHSKRSEKCDFPSTFMEIADSLPRLYVILDGLDECEEAATIVRSVTDIARKLPSLRLFCSSRPLQSSSHIFENVMKISLDCEVLRPDVDLFLSHELGGLFIRDSLRQEAFTKLSRASSGMFLYASLSVLAMKSAIDPHGMSEALDKLPEGINGLYAGLLKRLLQQTTDRRRLAKNVFTWVCCSERLLSWPELEYALSWDTDTEAFAVDRRPFRAVVMELCSPMIEYHEDRDVFAVSHHSVYEFLSKSGWELDLSNGEDQFLIDKTRAHGLISRKLVSNLAEKDVVEQVEVDPVQHPLVGYSTAHFCSHLVSADVGDQDLRRQVKLFMVNPQNRLTWIMRYILRNRASMPLQLLMRLQKLSRAWLEESVAPATFSVDDLADIQRTLLALDRLPPSVTAHNSISNFERLQYVRDLVRAFNMAGELPKAITLFAEALKSTQELDGSDAPSTAWLLNALGLLYDQQHLTDLAIQMQLQALSVQEHHLAPDLDLVNTINELGRLNRHAGRFPASENYHNKALAILQSILPETDLQVIWTINTLGRCLQKSGRAANALPLHRRALEVQRRTQGPDHPHAVWTLGDIARCQRDLALLPQAVQTLEEALERRTRVLGPKNPDTLWTVNDLGLLFEEMGHREKALESHLRAYQGQVEVLGALHAHTLWSLERINQLKAG